MVTMLIVAKRVRAAARFRRTSVPSSACCTCAFAPLDGAFGISVGPDRPTLYGSHGPLGEDALRRPPSTTS